MIILDHAITYKETNDHLQEFDKIYALWKILPDMSGNETDLLLNYQTQ